MIQKIRLTNFRNFKSKLLSFSDKITVILGVNATGKTNILEGIFLLATGKSFKAKIEEEMINHKESLARVKGKLESTILEVVLTRGEIKIGDAKIEKVSRKKMMIEGVSKRLIDFGKNFSVVVFGPRDLDLVTESPSNRRDYLNYVLSQADNEYKRAILSYEKGLRQRNRLLVRIREEGLSRTQLLFWDQLLIKNGDYISKMREEFIDFVNKTKALKDQNFKLEYDKSAISESRIEQYKEEEVSAATTLVGPHRDDFVFKVKTNGKNGKARELARYGSRGEQRMGVLWLKLAELLYMEEKLSQKPTLLLDDIFSELDHLHRDVVVKVAHNQQTIITTADPHFVTGFSGVEKIELK